MKGFFNRYMKIDLTREEVSYVELPDKVLSKILGGKGLGVHLLATENPVGVDPFAPEAVFILTVGPVTGTSMWSQSRFGAFTKSPATGGFGESYCGGSLGPKIKGCGVDALLITGRAEFLKYLVIDEKGASFRDAEEIAGAETAVAEEYILRDSPAGAGALVIGPAGENRVAFACIKSDRWRSLGRGGMGAVLGAKNIKGISFSGGRSCEIADDALLKSVIARIAQKGREMPVTEIYRRLGTPMQVKVTNQQKCFPTRYWQKGYFESWEKISADYMQDNFDVKAVGCPNCFIRCTKRCTVKQGRHAGLKIDGPEFETIYALGGLNEIDSLEEIVWLNDLCDRLGIDTMSAGNMAAFAIEAFKAGKTGYEIDYNQPDKTAEILIMTAGRQGIGDILANGIKRAAAALEMEDRAVHVKGLEPAGYDPRVLKGMGLSYATSARGACHLRGTFYKPELSGEMDRNQIAGKARLHVDYEDRAALFDSLVLCRFFRDFILWDELLDLVEAATGNRLSQPELAGLANNITNSSRAYNIREGLGPESDCLPPPLMEPTAEGAFLTRQELADMIQEYNEIRGGKY